MNKNRRNFLKKTALLGVSTSLIANKLLASTNNTISSISFDNSDYKALICLFLVGGNDSLNMLVPYEQSKYDDYKSLRELIAIPREDLNQLGAKGSDYSLHPKLSGMKTLFDEKKLAFVSNVGTLIEPTTNDSFTNKTVSLPPHLFSHNTQRDIWNSCQPEEFIKTGWAGRIADAYTHTSEFPLNLGIDTTNLWQKGLSSQAYIFDKTGAISFNKLDIGTRIRDSFNSINNIEKQNPLLATLNLLQKNTIERSETVETALKDVNLLTTFPTDENGNKSNLVKKFELIAKVIIQRSHFALPRNTFYLSQGGYDTHSDQLEDHEVLFEELNEALVAFEAEMTAQGLSNNVTTFASSDFGRTISTNNSGTDHGWGGHYFVMGGAVKGGEIYGSLPELKEGSSDIVKNGRLLPTTSVEQYVATLTKWFGLSDSSINELFPKLENFQTKDLGFMS